MTGRIVREGHTCETPEIGDHEAGTIWQCDDCQRYQRLEVRPNTMSGNLDHLYWSHMGLIEVAFAGLRNTTPSVTETPTTERHGA